MIKNNNLTKYWQGFKSKSPFSLIGISLIILSIFVLIPTLLVLVNMLTESYERYDYKKIISQGEVQNAKVENLVIKPNITYNNVSLRVVEYSYLQGGSVKSDKFQTVDLVGIESLKTRDSIKISVLNNESVVNDLMPYRLPFKMFWFIPVMFLVFGTPLFLLGHIAGMKCIKLAKNA